MLADFRFENGKKNSYKNIVKKKNIKINISIVVLRVQ